MQRERNKELLETFWYSCSTGLYENFESEEGSRRQALEEVVHRKIDAFGVGIDLPEMRFKKYTTDWNLLIETYFVDD